MTRRIGLNLLYLVPGETGGSEIYARELIPELIGAAPGDMRFVLFANRDAHPALAAEPWASEVDLVRVPVSGRSRVARVVAEQVLLGSYVRRHRVDLLHGLGTTAPAVAGAPQVVTILDVIYRHVPDTHSRGRLWAMRLLVPLAARRADRIITISHVAKGDIVDLLGVDAGMIDVTHLGCGASVVEPSPAADVRRRFDLDDGRPVVLSASAKREHKNLMRLMEAMATIDAATLVLPGYHTPFEEKLRERAEALGMAARVRFLGWIPAGDLEALYRLSSVFVFPSLQEGFGFPGLEAMRRGLPVACSRASCIPEVIGDAAEYFDPNDADDMARAIRRLLDDPAERTRLRRAGRERAALYSWRRTAEETIECYERVLCA